MLSLKNITASYGEQPFLCFPTTCPMSGQRQLQLAWGCINHTNCGLG